MALHKVVMEEVVLVDSQDRQVRTAEKMLAHQQGWLHRAFSICLFDTEGRWLLQRRAKTKYHSAGLLANSCCSHPRPGEDLLAAANRKLQQELGIECPLQWHTSFIYRAEVGHDLIEYEYDHIFVGTYSDLCSPNREEVSEVLWWTTEQIKEALPAAPQQFAAWFPLVFKQITIKD